MEGSIVKEIIKAQKGINAVPPPSVGIVGVEGCGGIAVFPKKLRQSGKLVGNKLLIGNASGRQEGHGVAGEKLKFRVGCVAAQDRDEYVAGNGVLASVKGAEEGHVILRGLEIADDGQIGKGLVHDDDDVGHIFIPGSEGGA